MTPKTELFGRIEDYCLDLLNNQEKLDFERELETNESLRKKVEIEKDIQSAITELDVLELRQKLQQISKEPASTITNNNLFESFDELTQVQELTDSLAPKALIESFESVPKVHVYQHELTSNENIHHYYEEQQVEQLEDENSSEELVDFDMASMEGLEDAILEDDILSLRDTLQQVSKSVEPHYSTEEIDKYLSGELEGDVLTNFESELAQNLDLQLDIELHEDIELAINEKEVIDLRGKLKQVMESETSWNVSQKSIEDFIDGVLDDEELLKEFSAELDENTDLMSELELRKEVNSAVSEFDIMSLREELDKAKSGVAQKDLKSMLIPQALRSNRVWINTAAAMVILLIGFAGILNSVLQSTDKTYNAYFDSPTWASERSVDNGIQYLNTARMHYQNANYEKVIHVLNNSKINEDEVFVANFYKGLSHQNIKNYADAIREYSQVIKHGNNLFIEEAEWYKALCYLKMNKKLEAKEELLAIIQRKGYYKDDAKAILRKIRYSLE